MFLQAKNLQKFALKNGLGKFNSKVLLFQDAKQAQGLRKTIKKIFGMNDFKGVT